MCNFTNFRVKKNFVKLNFRILLKSQNGIKVSTQQRARSRSQASREKLKEEREQIVLWKQPLTTLNYSTRELLITLLEWAQK